MPRWILDTGVFVRAQDADHLEPLLVAATGEGCVVPTDVHRELVSPPPGTRSQEKANRARKSWERCSGITVLGEFPLESAPGRLFRELRKGKQTPNDAGEAACIAWAAHEPDTVFVTADRKVV